MANHQDKRRISQLFDNVSRDLVRITTVKATTRNNIKSKINVVKTKAVTENWSFDTAEQVSYLLLAYNDVLINNGATSRESSVASLDIQSAAGSDRDAMESTKLDGNTSSDPVQSMLKDISKSLSAMERAIEKGVNTHKNALDNVTEYMYGTNNKLDELVEMTENKIMPKLGIKKVRRRFPTIEFKSQNEKIMDILEREVGMDEGYGVHIVPKSDNHCLVQFSVEDEARALLEKINKDGKTKDRLTSKLMGSRWPQMILHNVNTDFDKHTILNNVIKQNKHIITGDVRVQFSIPGKKGKHWVLSIKPQAFDKIQEKGWIFLGWRRYKFIEFFNLKRCKNCHEFGHLKKDCKDKPVCLKCFHDMDEGHKCTGVHDACYNCYQSNDKEESSYMTDHKTNDWECPNRLLQIRKFKNFIDYG